MPWNSKREHCCCRLVQFTKILLQQLKMIVYRPTSWICLWLVRHSNHWKLFCSSAVLILVLLHKGADADPAYGLRTRPLLSFIKTSAVSEYAGMTKWHRWWRRNKTLLYITVFISPCIENVDFKWFILNCVARPSNEENFISCLSCVRHVWCWKEQKKMDIC